MFSSPFALQYLINESFLVLIFHPESLNPTKTEFNETILRLGSFSQPSS